MTDFLATLETIRAKAKLPALGAITIVNGTTSEPFVVGATKLGGSQKALASDSFHLGSDTKAMTATLIGLLMDSGKLSPQSTLGEVVPFLLSGANPAWKSVRIDELLSHRAGLTELEPNGKTLDDLRKLPGKPREQRAAWLSARLMEKPDATRGKFAYSNAGYTILGAIAETIENSPWETLIVRKLWQPLGMDAARVGIPPRLWQHAGKDMTPIDPKENVDNPSFMAPAGISSMPLSDWAKFAALIAGTREKPLLSQKTLDYLRNPIGGGDYGGGWLCARRPWAGGVAVTHAGSNTMNFCNAWIAPARKFAVLVATNAGAPAAQTACDEVIGVVIRENFL